MAQLLRLEEFATDAPSGFGGTGAGAADSDTQRMASYEQGYQAGYDDAARTASEDQTRISAELSLNLQNLGFTFHEARSHVIQSLEPLLLALVEKLLPELVAKTIGQRILEEIAPLAEMAADTPIQVVIAPSCRAAIEPLLTAASAYPLELINEPSLGVGQVFLRSGKHEKQIDMDSVLAAITDAMAALERENSGAFAHG